MEILISILIYTFMAVFVFVSYRFYRVFCITLDTLKNVLHKLEDIDGKLKEINKKEKNRMLTEHWEA